MEYLNNFVITLVATIIFMTAVEIIAPDNSMKKYIKFVLGLILISVMINPIIKFFTGGEQEVVKIIKNYENMLTQGMTSESTSEDISETQKESFKKNLNSNCDSMLKEEFSDMDFKSNVECTINLEDMTYSIDGLEVGVKESGIKIVDKIKININDESEETVSNEENIENEEEIKKYLSEVFKIPVEKIKLYKMFQNKKFVNCLIVLLAIIFLWLAVSNFLGDDIGISKGSDTPQGAQEVSTDDGLMTSKELLNYEDQQKAELEKILSKMSGVGEVIVNIYFESGEIQVPATNSSTQTSETQEEDTNGGTRVTKQETEGTTVVMKSDSSTSEPFITKTYKPTITGVLIVAEGANSSEVKYNIQKAVSNLYNLSLDQVNVYPMNN